MKNDAGVSVYRIEPARMPDGMLSCLWRRARSGSAPSWCLLAIAVLAVRRHHHQRARRSPVMAASLDMMAGGDRRVQPVRTRPKDDQSSLSVSISSARVPSSELPLSFSPGDHTAIEAVLGAIARMPPPTPLLAGRPTR
jgi:hypothetical protein